MTTPLSYLTILPYVPSTLLSCFIPNRPPLLSLIHSSFPPTHTGGQRDMFDEVLKFGSMIVDALVAYQQPIFVYIPPFAELRGGAWVVVDSTINADIMEFYAAENSRGGVLEPAGAASIKFRDRDISATAHRVDHELIALDKKLLAAKADTASCAAITKQIKAREKALFGVFQQVAVHFADLHDTPGRMKAKGTFLLPFLSVQLCIVLCYTALSCTELLHSREM
jgi:acetyl-CoA carboxylase carboxyltransferase component